MKTALTILGFCIEKDKTMKNSTLCKRFGIEKRNAAQASQVIKATLEAGKIKVADEAHPRGGYLPEWA